MKIAWHERTMYVGFVLSQPRSLGLSVGMAEQHYMVTAVEFSGQATCAMDVFNDHSHKVIGDVYVTLDEALTAACEFADVWIATKDLMSL
jgi:hypothetical protein